MTDGGDWLSVGATTVVNDGYNNPSDKWFDKGKELDTTDWSYKTSEVSPGKDDIRTAHGLRQVRQRRRLLLRRAPSVSSPMARPTSTFELDRKPFKTWANGVSKPNRSVGDVIIPIDFENGGVQPVVRIYKVTGVTDSANGQVVTVGPDISTTSDIRSAINFVDLPDQGGGGVNAVPAFGFAELSINLSAIGINTSCPGLANGFVRSRSGSDPFSSDLKDFVTPFPIDLNNCGRLRIEQARRLQRRAAASAAPSSTSTPNPIPGGTGTAPSSSTTAPMTATARPARSRSTPPSRATYDGLRDQGAGRLQAACRSLP